MWQQEPRMRRAAALSGFVVREFVRLLPVPTSSSASFLAYSYGLAAPAAAVICFLNALGAVVWPEFHLEAWYVALGGSIVYFALAVLILKAAHAIAARLRERTCRSCETCGYNLMHHIEDACPACRNVIRVHGSKSVVAADSGAVPFTLRRR